MTLLGAICWCFFCSETYLEGSWWSQMHPNASNEKQVTSAIDRAYRQSEEFQRTSGLGTTGEPFGNFISVFTYPSWTCWICDCHFQVAMTSNRLDIMMISYCVSIRMVFRIWGTFHLFPGIKSVLHPRPRHMISGKARWLVSGYTP